MMKLSVFGSTGSIGRQTLALSSQMGYEVFSLAAGSDADGLLQQVREYKPLYATLSDRSAASCLRESVKSESLRTEVLDCEDAVVQMAGIKGADRVINAIVGSAGLKVSIRTLQMGTDLALANKESMVAAGELMRSEAEKGGSRILPVDSEHSAIWQCIWSSMGGEIRQIILTGSGGPFRGLSDLYKMTPEKALKHPTWSMGPKISIDSATLMNKALEVIEARWLFDVPAERIKVVIHPQSIVHSAVKFSDGSVVAQMGYPDMRLPILLAITYPNRSSCPPDGMGDLDLAALGALSFEPPDERVFPAVTLGHKALSIGGVAPAAMSAANEAAVDAFLGGCIPFTMIAELCEDAMVNCQRVEASSIEAILEADSWARIFVESRCASWHSCHS